MARRPLKRCINSFTPLSLGCHSLVDIDGKVMGDPLEEAALRAIKWKFDPASSTCKPTAKANVTWPAEYRCADVLNGVRVRGCNPGAPSFMLCRIPLMRSFSLLAPLSRYMSAITLRRLCSACQWSPQSQCPTKKQKCLLSPKVGSALSSQFVCLSNATTPVSLPFAHAFRS